MPSIITYRGMASITSPDPSGDAGLFIQNNTRAFVDNILATSGFLLNYDKTVSGYFDSKIVQISGLMSFNGGSGVTLGQLNTVSGYLDNRITFVSGLIGNTNNVALSGYFQSEINTLSSGLEFTGNGSGLYNLTASNLTFGSIPTNIITASNLANLTYVNNVSGWAASLVGGPSNSALSGYLDGRDQSISGYLDLRITTVSNVAGGISNVSGYLVGRDQAISGYIVGQLANYGTVVNDTNVSGYLDTRITVISGLISGGGGGSGNLSGPASSVSGTVPVFQGTTGKLLQDTSVSINNNGVINIGGRVESYKNLNGINIATDASSGSFFRVSLSGNSTLLNPTNASDGQVLRWQVKQPSSGMTFSLALDTLFNLGNFNNVLSTANSGINYIGTIYDSQRIMFDIIGFI